MIEQLISLGNAGMWAAVATLFTTALTATGRPGATVFLLLAVPTGLLESGLWEAHDWFFPPTHTWVLVVTGIWAVLEHAFRGEVYGDLMEALPLDQLMALLLIWLMFKGQIALGTSPADVPDLGLQMRRLIPVGPGLVLLGIAVPLNLVVGWARRQVVEVMRDLGFGGTAAVIEVVGVTGILVSVVGLPAPRACLAWIRLQNAIAYNASLCEDVARLARRNRDEEVTAQIRFLDGGSRSVRTMGLTFGEPAWFGPMMRLRAEVSAG